MKGEPGPKGPRRANRQRNQAGPRDRAQGLPKRSRGGLSRLIYARRPGLRSPRILSAAHLSSALSFTERASKYMQGVGEWESGWGEGGGEDREREEGSRIKRLAGKMGMEIDPKLIPSPPLPFLLFTSACETS